MPTWRTWFVILSLAGLTAWLVIPRTHDWLAITEPVDKAPYVIVEGWAPEYVLEKAIDYTKEVPVKRVFTTGVPLETGTYLTTYTNYSHLCAETLAKMGLAPG